MSQSSPSGASPMEADQCSSITELLRSRFARYRTENLQAVEPAAFQSYIESLIGTIDNTVEGYSAEELDRQRDLSIKFHWGHNHDFGTFQVEGRMHDRHINMLATFLELFPITVADFDGADTFDIGCWTGGTSLLLAALGSRVFAIEEVRRYGDTARYLAQAFGLQDQITAESRSLYACNEPAFYDRFDIVYFPGVIYHLSDPLIGLRILFNAMRAGGQIMIESAGIDHAEPLCEFQGSQIYLSGDRESLNRGGWNWFIPSPSALERMMREAGFEEVQSVWHEPAQRVYAYGRKRAQVGICRAGLSVPDIL